MLRQLTDVLQKRRTPRVVAIIPSYIASCQINVIKPLSALASSGQITFKHQTEQSTTPSAIEWADLIVYCRNTEPGFRHLLNEALGRRKPIIYDIDDSFWDIPSATDPDLARYHTQPSRLNQLESYLQHASLVRVYSPLLKTKVARFNSNVRVYNSSFDFKQVPDVRTLHHNKAKIGIVYATSRTVDDQYKVFLPALSEFLNQHQDKAEMTVWGCRPPELLTLPGVTHRKLLPRYDQFLREFSRSGFNIGLAPLEDNEFNRSKNNTKFRDYGACGIAGIYSNVDAYSSSVEHERNGLLVENTKHDWLKALQRLAFDKDLQESIRHSAHEKVFENYRQELIERQWLEDIHSLLVETPSFWLANARASATISLNVIAESDYLCGVEFHKLQTRHSENLEPLYLPDSDGTSALQNQLHLEIQSPTGQILRGIASSAMNFHDGVISFKFEAIRNSQDKPFKLQITGISDRRQANKFSCNGEEYSETLKGAARESSQPLSVRLLYSR